MVLLWFQKGRGSLGSRTESWWPAEPPFSDEKLLVGVFRVQVVGPLLWALRSGRQPPPAAGRAPRLHSVIRGFARRQPPRPESPSRRAGQTMELGAGPAGAARSRRERTDRLAATGVEAGRRSGELTHAKVKAPSLDFDLQVFVSPPKAAAAGAVPSAPRAVSLQPPLYPHGS